MDSKLNQAIAAIKAGDKVSGGNILAELVKSEPGNEHAWYWLSLCVKSTELKKNCLKHVLQINPANLKASKALAQLERPVKEPSRLLKFFANGKFAALAGLGIVILSATGVILVVAYYSARISASQAAAAPIAGTEFVAVVPTGEDAGEPLRVSTPTRAPKYTQIPGVSSVDPYGNAEYNLPPAPKGFTWKVIPSLLMDTLVPDGWFFVLGQEDEADIFFVTKEEVDANGQFSTGMSVKIFHNTEDVDQAAQDIIADVSNLTTTTQVIDSFQMDSKSKTINMYSVLIAEEFPDRDSGDPNYHKKMVCNAIADSFKKTLYIIKFEAPKDVWDTEWNERGGPITLSVINLLFAGR